MKIFDLQIEVALANLPRIHQAVGDQVSVVLVSGADYGTQNGPLCAPAAFADLFQPYHMRINDWIHENTKWKIMIHSCGGIAPLLDHFHEMGVDILNPVPTQQGRRRRGARTQSGTLESLEVWRLRSAWD
ncbi:MAG: hypothetical protein NTW21_42290 [Verrucomicrobia bacterium]|nr:hypothetical protein [Verrucomicrobiota bacterium]